MDFSIKKNQARKRKLGSHKTKTTHQPNEDITSSEDDESQEGQDLLTEIYFGQETAQEKKLRLAKIYLQEIEDIEKKKIQDQELDEACKGVFVRKQLKEDYLKQRGQLKLSVAHEYKGADVENVKILTCKEHRQSILALCVNNENTMVFTGSKDGSIVKWCLEKYTKLLSKSNFKKNMPGVHISAVLCLAITTDSRFLVSGNKNDIQIWDPSNLNHLKTLSGHRGTVTGLVFRKGTHTLYSSSNDRSVKIWCLDEMCYVDSLYGHLDEITSIDALAKEHVITSGGRDKSIRLWKIAEESQMIYDGHDGNIDCISFINDNTFISGSDNGVLNVWVINKKKPLCEVLNAHGINELNQVPYWICSVASLVNTDIVASGSHNGIIKFWQLSESFKKITSLFEVPVQGFINAMAFINDGQYLVAGIGRDHRFGRWEVIISAKNSVVVIPLQKINKNS